MSAMMCLIVNVTMKVMIKVSDYDDVMFTLWLCNVYTMMM